MKKAQKFDEVDLLNVMEQIVQIHTRHYQDDFEIDKRQIGKLADSPERESRFLIWMSRPNGTNCFSERDVFLRESYANLAVMHYFERTYDPILAYAVELQKKEDGRLIGRMQELNFCAFAARVSKKALPTATVTTEFADGYSEVIPYPSFQPLLRVLMEKHGPPSKITFDPKDMRDLTELLQQERANRSRETVPGDIDAHLAKLREASVRERLEKAKSTVSSLQKDIERIKDVIR